MRATGIDTALLRGYTTNTMTGTVADQVAVYQRAARRREERRQRELAERRQQAGRVAQAAAQLLKMRFGATRVILFGSAAHGQGFHPESDIDLAAEGIVPADFWRAWAALDTIDRSFEINLIAVEEATPSLQAEIELHGVPL